MNTPACDPVTPHHIGQWTFNEGSGEKVIDSSGARNDGFFDRYAGGVELRRVQSRRPFIQQALSESEKHVEENFQKLQDWKNDFEQRNGRLPTKGDMLLADPEIMAIARRLGVNGVPCFIVNRKYAVSGAQSPEVLVQVFDLANQDAPPLSD